MASIARERGGVKAKAVFAAALAETQAELVKRLGEAVGKGLDANIETMLGRSAYVRREEIAPWVEVKAVCHRCKCRHSQRLLRNGHRRHTVLTLWGEVKVWVQRLVCVCGGSVQLEMDGWLRPYQRIGDDVEERIRRMGALRLSLREMQAELERLHLPPLALRTLNQRLQQIATPGTAPTPTGTPPVVQVDALWVTQLVPTGTYHRDAKGRRRPDKKRIKRPIFIALGVWPETGQAEVLAWQLAPAEDTAAWLAFLSELEAMGVRGENGLELIIHDGGVGLCAALNIVHVAAAEQRCLFHKLRNLYNAIRVADDSRVRSNIVPGKRFSATSTTSGRRNASPPCSNAIATSSNAIDSLNPRLSVVFALTSAQPWPISPSTNGILTGTSPISAPPADSNASTAASAAALAPPPPIIPMLAYELWSHRKWLLSVQPQPLSEFQPKKIHYLSA